MDLDYFVKYFNEHDGFSKHNGLKLLKMEPGYAEAEFTVSDENLNFMALDTAACFSDLWT